MFHVNASFEEAYSNYEKLLQEKKDRPDDLTWLQDVFLSYAKLRADKKDDPLAKEWVAKNLKPDVFAMGSCLNTGNAGDAEGDEKSKEIYVFQTEADYDLESDDQEHSSDGRGGYTEDGIQYDAWGYEIGLDKRLKETLAIEPELAYDEEAYKAACEELEKLIGLKATKKKIKEIHAFAKVHNLMKERELEVSLPVFHSIFAGPPGTGKTTVARLYADILKAAGILGRGHMVEVSRSELTGTYIGDEQYKTKKAVTDTIDGVLFIDEAHDLYNSNDVWDYGHRVLGTLLKLMEDYRDRFVVIFAGYEDPIRKTLLQFEGFESRVPHTIPFEDFTPEEMADIFYLLCEEQGRLLNADLRVDLANGIKQINRKTNKKMNGREIRNYFEKALMNHAMRVSNLEEVSDTQLLTFEKEDLDLLIPTDKDNITYLKP